MVYNYPLLGGIVFFVLLLITRGFNYPCCVLPSQMRAMKNMLAQITSRFHDLNHTYVIGEGTLLGIFRDGDLIRWDSDIDLHLPSCQETINLLLQDEFLSEFPMGCRCNCSIGCTQVKVYHPRSFRQSGSLLKVLYKRLYVELSLNFSNINRRERFNGFGFLFYGPSNAHEVLQNEYGSSYLKPIKGEDGGAGTNQFTGICHMIAFSCEIMVFGIWMICCFGRRFYNGANECIAVLFIPVNLLFCLLCFLELAVPFE